MDEITLQCRHPPMNDFFISFFLEQEENFKYFRHFTGQIMLNNAIEKDMWKLTDGRESLKQYRICIVKHWMTIVEMIQRKLDSLPPDGVSEKLQTSELLRKLNFLVDPVRAK